MSSARGAFLFFWDVRIVVGRKKSTFDSIYRHQKCTDWKKTSGIDTDVVNNQQSWNCMEDVDEWLGHWQTTISFALLLLYWDETFKWTEYELIFLIMSARCYFRQHCLSWTQIWYIIWLQSIIHIYILAKRRLKSGIDYFYLNAVHFTNINQFYQSWKNCFFSHWWVFVCFLESSLYSFCLFRLKFE